MRVNTGRRSRRKGYEGEREFARLTGGKRVPLSGAQDGYPGDVQALGLLWEVKRRKDSWRELYQWLDGVDAVALRADNRQWLVVMTLDKFREVTGR